MSKKTIFVVVSKITGFNVFEALKLHLSLFEKAGYEVTVLTRKKGLDYNNIKYFDRDIDLIKYLRKNRSSFIYGITIIEIFFAFLSNIRNKKVSIIYWVQGLLDEEDYFKHRNTYRRTLFYYLSKIALKVSHKIICVTPKMHEVLIDRYGLSSSKDSLIVNCKSRLNYRPNIDRIPFSLCYIGSLTKWQSIDKVLLFFNLLVKSNGSYELYLATFDHKKATKLISEYINPEFLSKVNLVSVTKSSEVENFLSSMEYGFLLRDDTLLNNVASPIKLAEYLSCGVTPILSDGLTAYASTISRENSGVVVVQEDYSSALGGILNKRPEPLKALKYYEKYFENSLSIQEMKDFLSK